MKKLAILLLGAALVFSFFVNGDLPFTALAKEETGAQNKEEKKPEITVQLDKNFGYFVGDIVFVRYQIKMPPESDWGISSKDLPQAGQTVSQGIEIREIKTHQSQENSRAIITLEIKFQIFRVFNQPKNLSLPAIAFFYGPPENPRQIKGSLPTVEIKISPLTGPEEPLLQSFFEPPVKPIQWTLIIVFGGGLLMLGGWFWLLIIFINRHRHPSSFKKAIKEIKKMKAEDYKEALLVFQHSLSERTGQAIFSHNLNELFRIIPPARKHAEEISKILELCDNLHFNPNFQPEPKTLFGLKNRLVLELKYLLRSEKWK